MTTNNIIIIAVIIGVIYAYLEYVKAKKLKESQNAYLEKLLELKNEYEKLLKGGNKAQALTAGRAYYSWMRKQAKVMEGPNGSLSIYDEQAITNDLSTM